MKIFSWFLVISGFAVLGTTMFFGIEAIGNEYSKVADSASSSVSTVFNQYKKTKVITPDEYTVVLVGDMMLDRGVKARVGSVMGGDYNKIFDNIRSVLSGADVTFGNLEGSISNVGADTGKPYSFRFEPEVASAVANAGFDVVSLANNHIFDWGHDSLCATLTNLTAVNVFGVGAGCNKERADQSYVKTFPDGTKIAFLAFTEFYKGGFARDETPGLAHYDIDNMKQRITDMKEKGVDIIFVSFHWGIEYDTRSSKAQQDLAKTLIDSGADVIVGHHPHVAQEVEKYKDSWIIYSLGNFVFDQKFSEETMKGLLANVVIRDKAVVEIEPIVIYLNENYQPSIDPDGKYTYLKGVLSNRTEELEVL